MKNIKKTVLAIVLIATTMVSALLFACATPKYTITFNANGGNEVPAVTLEQGTEYVLPTAERTGYEFAGWYTSSTFEGEAVTKVTANEDVTFYAKWNQLGKITLNLDGGSLDKTEYYLKPGENVYNFVSTLVPVKAGYVFGAWYNGETELNKNERMTLNGITLTAKYKVEYTVEYYLQNVALDGYELGKTVKGAAYAGTVFTEEPTYTGFVLVPDDLQRVVSENASENVFKFNFDREDYVLTFNSNYPFEEAENEEVSFDVKYGVPFAVPSDLYECEGNYLKGWGTSVTGELLYKANYLAKVLRNAQSIDVVDTVVPERNTTFYGVWNKGLRDMFGGSDYVYLEKDGVCYLSKSNVFFMGEYNENKKTFRFTDGNDELLEGKINEDGTFAYYDESRSGDSAQLYRVGTGLVDGTNVYFDAYNGITYATFGPDGKTRLESKGTYAIDENGQYVITFTEGQLEGQTLVIIVGYVNIDGAKTSAFQLRNEEEYSMGPIYCGLVHEGTLTYYYNQEDPDISAYLVKLGGFGTCSYYTGQTYSLTYTYDSASKTLKLFNGGSLYQTAKVIDMNGKNVYITYDEKYDITYENEDGSTLTLDGTVNATYTDGETTVSGYYTLSTSAFGSTLVTITSSGKTYLYEVIAKTEEITTGTGDKKTETTYSFNVKPSAYAEFYYKDEAGIYYMPLIVLDDEEVGVASVYGYTTEKKFVRLFANAYSYDETTGLYTINVLDFPKGEYGLFNDKTEVYILESGEQVLTSPVNLAKVKAFTFKTGLASNYPVNFWYSVTGETETRDCTLTYTSANGGKLVLAGGMATISEQGIVMTGAYTLKGDIMTITVSQGSLLVEINETAKTFAQLTVAPYVDYSLNADGTTTQYPNLSFDGKGGATYTFLEG